MKFLHKYFAILLLSCFIAGPLAAQDTVAVPVEYTEDDSEIYAEDSAEVYAENSDEVFDVKERQLSEEDWKLLTADTAYYYANEREEEKTEKPPVSSGLEKAVVSFFQFLGSGAGKIIFWILIFSVLGYIIYRILKGDIQFVFGRKEKQKAEDISELVAAEDLLNINWETKMTEALQDGDTRTATRYAFVSALQLLHRNQHINYQPNTTNFEYYLSLKNDNLKQVFRKLLLRYEYAWFGKFEVTEAEWQLTYSLYQQLKSNL